jgi:hypothetical protein
MFIIGLATKEKPPTFEELMGILLQEKERRGNLKPQNKYLALCSNKRSAREISGERGRGGSSSQRRQSPRMNQSMQSNRIESKSCFIVVDLDILLETVIRRRVMRLGINLEHIQVIM